MHQLFCFSDFRNNKGCILKASVDYIRDLRRDQQRLKLLEDKLKQTERQKKLLMLRLQVRDLRVCVHYVLLMDIAKRKPTS